MQKTAVTIYKETHRERALSHEASKSGFKFNSVRCNALWPCSFESGWNDSFDGISQSREKIDRWKRWESSISRLDFDVSGKPLSIHFVSLPSFESQFLQDLGKIYYDSGRNWSFKNPSLWKRRNNIFQKLETEIWDLSWIKRTFEKFPIGRNWWIWKETNGRNGRAKRIVTKLLRC